MNSTKKKECIRGYTCMLELLEKNVAILFVVLLYSIRGYTYNPKSCIVINIGKKKR